MMALGTLKLAVNIGWPRSGSSWPRLTVASCGHMIHHMVQLLIQLDEETAEQLEQVASGRSRKRSEFVRMAIRRALLDVADQATQRAYAKHPDNEPIHFAADDWARSKPRRRK
jgi:Arc/MetJ-type ribon-helix-helix transcriptional regulator